MSENILELNKLDIGINQKILNSININCGKPKIVYLMGRNGSGKSTLLKTICGLIKPLNGEITISNMNITDYVGAELAKVLSIVLTERLQTDYLTVEDLIALGRTPYTNWLNQLSLNDHEIINKVIDDLEIATLRKLYFNELSDGQKQKVLLARALVQSPKILLLDEPMSFLDIPSKVDFLNILKKIKYEKNILIIMSTHETLNMFDIAEEFWIIDENFIHVNSPDNVKKSGLLKKVFGLNLI